MNAFSPRWLIVLGLTVAITETRGQTPVSATGVFPPDSVVRSGTLTVMRWDHPQVTIIEVPDTICFLYLPRNLATLDSIARRESLRAVINGSFFEGVRGNARHAGWLSVYGRQVTPMMEDRQLTHVVCVNSSKHSMEFLPVSSFQASATARVLEFQTGPLVIEHGVIREDLIRSSINGSSRHARTLLATLDHHRCFFITVTDRVSLSDLAGVLLRLSVFQKGRLDVMNLDGGSSVALYVRDAAGVGFNVGDRLPLLIGFH